MGDVFLRIITAIVAGVAVLLWAAAVVVGVIYSVKSGTDPDFVTADGMKYFMPGLTALVGGVVAAAFGLPPDADSQRNRHLMLGNVLAAKPTTAVPPEPGLRKLLGRAYVITYLLFGLAAALTWVLIGGDTVEYIRILASAYGGLFFGIAQAALR